MKRVLLSHKKIIDYSKNFKREEDVEFPELSGKMGFSEDVIPVLKIRAASLDDQIRAQTLYEKVGVMALQMIEAIKNKDATKIISFEQMNKEIMAPINEKSHLEILIFKRCVVQPKFTLKECVLISEVLPEVVNRVAKRALQLSSLENVNNDNRKRS